MGKGTYNINLFDLRIGKIAMENANGTCSICCFPMKWSVRFCMKEKREEWPVPILGFFQMWVSPLKNFIPNTSSIVGRLIKLRTYQRSGNITRVCGGFNSIPYYQSLGSQIASWCHETRRKIRLTFQSLNSRTLRRNSNTWSLSDCLVTVRRHNVSWYNLWSSLQTFQSSTWYMASPDPNKANRNMKCWQFNSPAAKAAAHSTTGFCS